MNEPLIALVRDADGIVRRRFVDLFAATAKRTAPAATETSRRIGSGGALRLMPSG
jgi:hypothetical protein